LNSVKSREISIPLGIVVEKRKSSHPWADWDWRPVSVILNAPAGVEWQEMMRGDDRIQYHAGTLVLTLHRKDTEALRANLMLPEPELYVALQENEEDDDGGFPYSPYVVTASPYEAQDLSDADLGIVEKVAMPEALAALITAFVEEHHVEQEFIKRKRDEFKLEQQKFGKEPIFSGRTKH
jgi:hypothetical protein